MTTLNEIEHFRFSLGIFKNDQKQIDEYLSALNPLLRRTTEGKNDDVKGQTTDTSISNLLEIDLSKSRMIIKKQQLILAFHCSI